MNVKAQVSTTYTLDLGGGVIIRDAVSESVHGIRLWRGKLVPSGDGCEIVTKDSMPGAHMVLANIFGLSIDGEQVLTASPNVLKACERDLKTTAETECWLVVCRSGDAKKASGDPSEFYLVETDAHKRADGLAGFAPERWLMRPAPAGGEDAE